MSHLTVLITNKCNLDCNFCSNQVIMRDDSRPDKSLDDLLESFLIENEGKYHTFHISGGEPLINIDLLEEILSVILTYVPKAKINLYTNACYLTDEIAYSLNQYSNIKVNISIDRLLKGERRFFKLLENDYRTGYGNLHAIQMLKNKVLRSVLQRQDFKDFTLASELILLQRFFQCPLYLDHDWSDDNLNAFDLDDVYNIGELIIRLEALQVTDAEIQFNKFFTHPCEGECSDVFKWDGSVKEGCHLQSEIGCEKLRQRFKPGIYDLLLQFVNYRQFDFNTQLKDVPKYDKEVGYVGERNELQPLRKQLQFEERTNIRFNKLSSIEIKEVH